MNKTTTGNQSKKTTFCFCSTDLCNRSTSIFMIIFLVILCILIIGIMSICFICIFNCIRRKEEKGKRRKPISHLDIDISSIFVRDCYFHEYCFNRRRIDHFTAKINKYFCSSTLLLLSKQTCVFTCLSKSNHFHV